MGSATVYFEGPSFPGEIEVQNVYKPSRGAIGHLRRTTCNLHTAMVQYPVEVSNGTVTLTPQSVFKNNTVELQYPVEEYAGLGIWPSSVGGIAVAAQTLFGGNKYVTLLRLHLRH